MAIIKGFIFDLDGVLVDTARYHFQAWQRLAEELDIKFTEKDNEQLKGIGRKESLEKILEWGQRELLEDEKQALMDRKNRWYQELIGAMDRESTLPGAREFLEAARGLNLPIALGSASKNAAMILASTELEEYFDTIVDGTQITRSKPDPQGFLLAAERLHLPPESLVVFEDSKAGLEAAERGGFRRVGIGKKKNLPGAELVVSGLIKVQPAEVINQLNL